MQYLEYLAQGHANSLPQAVNNSPEIEEAPEKAAVFGPFWTPWGWRVIWLPSDGVARRRNFPSYREAATFAKQIASRLLIDEWAKDIYRVTTASSRSTAFTGAHQ